MKKKLLVSAVAFATFSTAQASTFLSQDPVESVYDYDTAFDNPAYLATTENQLSFSDFGTAGYVNNAFGQKIGIHVGRLSTNLGNTINNVDLFWAGNVGIGAVGVRVGYGLDTNKDDFKQDFLTTDGLSSLNVDALTDYDYFENDGTTTINVGAADTASLDVDANETVNNASMSQIQAGLKLNDLPLDLVFSFSLPTSDETDTFNVTDVYNTDGQTTATNRTTNTLEYTEGTKRTGGLITSLSGRFQLRDDMFVLGALSIDNNETTETISASFDELDIDLTGPTTNVDQLTEEETKSVVADNNTTLMLGLDHRVALGAAKFKVQPSVWYTSSKTETKNSVVKDTFTNTLNAAANTTAATGVTDLELIESTNITGNIAVQAEYATSAKWIWRAGTTIGLLDINSTTTTTKVNKVNQAADGYEEDYVQINSEATDVEFLNFTNTLNLGFTVKANDIVSLDVNLESNQNALQNWTADFGLKILY
ncbi:hypothetical protein [Reinekea sp. G2M2-21]|uniref:hypothetical protein n=1 Tax=Reinekea sp. G2M2-21 TaxID=2788942 RepID=UPI0018AC63CA|nr:hypothetical protein [Reinekea sp. G2M2-21]